MLDFSSTGTPTGIPWCTACGISAKRPFSGLGGLGLQEGGATDDETSDLSLTLNCLLDILGQRSRGMEPAGHSWNNVSAKSLLFKLPVFVFPASNCLCWVSRYVFIDFLMFLTLFSCAKRSRKNGRKATGSTEFWMEFFPRCTSLWRWKDQKLWITVPSTWIRTLHNL